MHDGSGIIKKNKTKNKNFKYKLIEISNSINFSELINKYIDDGWELVGNHCSIAFNYEIYYSQMMRKKI